MSLLEPYQISIRPARAQPPRAPEEVEGDIEWEVDRVVWIEIISYTRRVRRRNKVFRELRYFVKWKGCSEDENTWEPPEHLEGAAELVAEFDRSNPEMPGRAEVE